MIIEIWNYDVMLWRGEVDSVASAREALWRKHPCYRAMTTQAKIVGQPDFLNVLPGDPSRRPMP